jgi:hypothetical protein
MAAVAHVIEMLLCESGFDLVNRLRDWPTRRAISSGKVFGSSSVSRCASRGRAIEADSVSQT